MKKILCVFLTWVMVLSLAACGGDEGSKSQGEQPGKQDPVAEQSGDNTVYFGSEAGKEKLQKNGNPLDPAGVYSNVGFNERMLYGRFTLANSEKNRDAFIRDAVFADLTYSETYSIYSAEENMQTQKLSTLPIQVDLGPSGCSYGRKLRGEYEWAELYLVNENGNDIRVLCTYTVSGDTISFTPLDGYEEVQDENFLAKTIRYTVGEDSIDYTFRLQGTSLTLTRDGKSVTLKSWYFSDNGASSISYGGFLAADSPAFAGLDNILCTASDSYTSVYLTALDGELYSNTLHNACVGVNENGQVSFYWETTDENGNVEEHLEHLVYYPGDGNSMTLTDGDRVYYYTETSITRQTQAIGMGMSREEQEQLNNLSDSQIQQIAQKKADLLEDLAKAYEDAGLNVTINSRTGEIALDSTVLFAVNESEISEEGRAFLQQFTQIYTSVVYSDAYADFVSRIVVEGHTDTTGSYEQNQILSQERADSVKAYCQSEECGVEEAVREQFVQSLEAVGYSCDKPIYGEDGEVDMDASRRVSFRFVVRLTADGEM